MMRQGNELVRATTPFAHEDRRRSWWCLGSTLVALLGLLTATCLPLHWLLLTPCSVLAGLVLARLFILYHDYQHGAILQRSAVAGAILWLYGILVLTPPSIWDRSHKHHHKHNAKMLGADIGSYPVMTTAVYARSTRLEQLQYRAARHPLTMLLAYVTIFLFGMCLKPLLGKPREHADAGLALGLHLGLVVTLALFAPAALAWTLVLPLMVFHTVAAYVFYAQHNFPGVQIKARGEWDYVFAALHSSSHMTMSPLMNWFTGNIGYHHVHHLNAHIPFYRLPEAMAAIEELQAPTTTSLRPWDVYRCLRLNLWDPERGRMVTFGEALPTATPSAA